MLSDFLISFQWWLVLFLLGLFFFPLTSYFFPRFIDRGYSLSKTVGAVLLSYSMFLTGTLHILSFSLESLIILLLIMAGLMFFVTRKFSLPLSSPILLMKQQMMWIITEEILFLVIFVFWVYVRSFTPDINGLEKFMDYGFVNAILRAEFFPAKDMWFAPFSINYYYFGHLATAVLTKLSLLPSNYTYNLMIATLAGLTFVSSFSIAINFYNQIITKRHFLKYLVAGILTASIVTFSGNLHTLYTFFKPYENEHPVPLWQLAFSPQTFPNAYWYPNATRFIHNTIHEFPIYSWTVSDLHGHVTDIPFVLLTIALLYSMLLGASKTLRKPILQKKKNTLSFYYHKITSELPLSLPQMLFLSLLLAVLYMTNAWDGLIYLLLALIFIAYLEWQTIKKERTSPAMRLFLLLVELVFPALVLGGGFILFSLPFSLFFKPFVSGIGVLCAPTFLTNLGHIGPFLFEPDHCQHSPWWQLLILYGFFAFFVIALVIGLIKTKKHAPSDVFAVLLMILATILVIVPEFIYAKDIYPAHYRANTMFKLVFQSFIMLSLVSGYSISRLSIFLKASKTSLARVGYTAFFLLSLGLLTLVFIYPYFAIMSYYGDLKVYKGLDGTAYLNQRYPDDARAIKALNESINIKGQPVILEAQGDSYTDYARVSANTGLPTVLGWTVHEWLWRGSYDIPAPRIDEVKQMYESDDFEKTKRLLKKYNVKYIFLGQLEREKYQVNEEKFNQLGKAIYTSGKTKIYDVK